MVLLVKNEGKVDFEKSFKSFEELKNYLVANTDDLFGWIQENEPERELPNFTECETLVDIEIILNDYDYSWWNIDIVNNEKRY